MSAAAESLTLDDIRVAVQERLKVVRAAKEEYDRLQAALIALGAGTQGAGAPRRRSRHRDPEAPYGRKADGSPRKRPGRPASSGGPELAASDTGR